MAKKQMSVNDVPPSVNGNHAPEVLTSERTESCRIEVPPVESDLALWDLEQLRLPPEVTTVVADEPTLTKLPVRRPDKQEWFRVRPGEAWRFSTAVLILQEDRSTYLVAPTVQGILEEDLVYVCLYTVVTRTGTLLLWPVRLVLPDKPSGGDSWYESAHSAATIAETTWIRLLPANRGYHIKQARVDVEPTWPTGIQKIEELVYLAFKERFIASSDHPVVRQLLEGV
jgi:hypothetical protein